MSREPYIESVRAADPYGEHQLSIEVRFLYGGLKSDVCDTDYIDEHEAIRLIGELANAITTLRKRASR